MKCAIGLDFGTLSVRALLVDTSNGQELASAVEEYPCGVITQHLPGGTALPAGYALADPLDYLACMRAAVRGVLAQARPAAPEITGIGVDATSSSTLPVDAAGTPLSVYFPKRPHAYLKLWKHHGAYRQAEMLQSAARRQNAAWLPYYGGGVLCELLLPKALETAQEDPAVWDAADSYLELGDWLVWQLTGRRSRSLCIAGCNSFYRPPAGYPAETLFREAAPGTAPVTQKLGGALLPLGQAAGALTPRMAQALGLPEGIPVAAAMIDSHAAVTGCGACAAGDLTAVLGTSACYLLNAAEERCVPGISASSYETLSRGLFGYEGGQSSVGDALDWFLKNCVPGSLEAKAAQKGISLHALLSEEAGRIPLGESGVFALDWLNGARTPQRDPRLRGVFAGLSLQTTPPAMYRALLESICCGARRILAGFEDAGLPVKRIFAAGGIPHKNPFFMQLLADVLGRELFVSESRQCSALGSAIMGAAVSGTQGSLSDCIHRMASPVKAVYSPAEKREAADALYENYRQLAARFENA